MRDNKMGKGKKAFIIILSINLLFFVTVGILLIPIHADWYSVSYHQKRVEKRAEKRYVKSGECTDIEVYPIYDENEK